MQRYLIHLGILGAAIECGLAGMLAARPVPGRTLPLLVLFSCVFVLYLAAVRLVLAKTGTDDHPAAPIQDAPRDRTGWLIVGAACLFRLTFLAAQPALGGDVYRYLWDGRVTLRGGNPYLEEPAARRAASGVDEGDLARLEHPDVPTIYPPGAQALFLAGAALHAGVPGIKVLIIAADLLLVVALRRLLRLRGQAPARALIYAWNPLAVTESAWSGHLDPVAILLVVVAAGAIIQKRHIRAALAIAAGGLVKFLPLVLAVPLFRRAPRRALAWTPLVLVAAYWPFRDASWRLFAGLRIYADRWMANESLFALVLAGIAWLDPTPRLKTAIAWIRANIPHTGPIDRLYAYVYPIDLAKGLCALLVLGLAIHLWRRRTDPLRGCFVLTAGILLLSPTVHPWYVLWILPWLCLFPSRAFLLWSGLVFLAYANLGAMGRAGEAYPLIRVVEYAPFYALLIAEILGRRAARSPSPGGSLAGPATGC